MQVIVNCPALVDLRLQASLADPVPHITRIDISSRAMSSISWGSIVDLEHLTLMCPIMLEVRSRNALMLSACWAFLGVLKGCILRLCLIQLLMPLALVTGLCQK